MLKMKKEKYKQGFIIFSMIFNLLLINIFDLF